MSQPPPPPNQPPGQPPNQPPEQPGQPPNQPPGPPQDPLAKQPEGQPPQQPPSQPPNQPPSGGFGAPQDPSYGYPQQPPPGQTPPPPGQPPQGGGYGYPQAPGQPPQGGYGYPGQQPQGPYGQPGPYGQQPTYPMPAGGMPPGGAGNNNKKLMIIIASVVAVALIAVGGVFILTSGDDKSDESKGDPKGGSSSEGGTGGDGGDSGGDDSGGGDGGGGKKSGSFELAWQAEPPKSIESDILMEVQGTWFVDGKVIKYEEDGVQAYDAKSGEEAWSIDAVRGDKCAAARGSSDNKTMILWGRKCEKAMGIDLATGKQLWDADLPGREEGETPRVSYPEVAVSGDTAAVAWIGGSAAYGLSDGKERWKAKSGTDCRDRAYIGGERLLAKVECGYGTKTSMLQELDSKGKKQAEWEVSEGAEIKRVFSTDPLVVGVNAGGKSNDITDIMLLSDKLKLEQKIAVDPERFRYKCSDILTSSCFNVLVDKDKNQIYLETKMHSGEDGRTNEIVAYDLKSGKNKWVSEPTDSGETQPLALHDGKLLALQKGGYSSAGMVTEIDTDSGKAKEYRKFQASDQDVVRDMTSIGKTRPFWQDSALYMVTEKLYKKGNLNKGWIVAFQ